MTEHPEYLGLMADVIASPDDDVPRLIAADWLDDHGEHGHAAFVRFQVANPWAEWACTPLFPKGTFDGLEYAPPLPAMCERAVYRRGFVEEVLVVARNWKTVGGRLARVNPLRRVRVLLSAVKVGSHVDVEEVEPRQSYAASYFFYVTEDLEAIDGVFGGRAIALWKAFDTREQAAEAMTRYMLAAVSPRCRQTVAKGPGTAGVAGTA